MNLIINASHAISESQKKQSISSKGTIKITTLHNNNWVEIHISDTGAGIPEEVQANVFDPFFTTKKVGKGSGQGLMLAHNCIMKKHHGTISFKTKINEGTTFIIQLSLGTSSSSQAVTSDDSTT